MVSPRIVLFIFSSASLIVLNVVILAWLCHGRCLPGACRGLLAITCFMKLIITISHVVTVEIRFECFQCLLEPIKASKRSLFIVVVGSSICSSTSFVVVL